MLDGILGDTDWRKGFWHGYQDQDFVGVIDLKGLVAVTTIGCSFLQDLRSWILFPKDVEFLTSVDGVNFTTFAHEAIIPDDKNEQVMLKKITTNFNGTKARYIKIVAKNYGALPEGHPGEGEPAFIFMDEIEIK